MNATRTILLMDDNPDILETMRTVLSSRGYRVLTAGDGLTGLTIAQTERPDLVVVDMMMPRRSGFFVLETLKGHDRSARVIMISANDSVQHRAYAEALGVDDFIRKPFSIERFLESVDQLCPLHPSAVAR